MRPLFRTATVYLALFLIALTGAASAEVLTLDDCIELALKNRISIIRARGDETRASADQRAALGAFLPRIDATYSYSKTKTTDIEQGVVGMPSVPGKDQDRTSKGLDATASIWIFNPATWFNYFGAKADRASAHLDVIASEQDMIYSVKSMYYAFLASSENVSVQDQAVKRSEEQLKLTESKYELGSAALSDVLKQKVQFGNDRLDMLSAQNAVMDGKARLAYTIGIDPNKDWEFSTEYTVRQIDGSLEELTQFGMEHQPSLLAAQKGLDASKYALRSRKSDYLPKASVFGRYSLSDGTSGDTLIFNFSSKSKTYGFRVTWSIFDGFSRERNLSYAGVNRNNAAAALSDMRFLTAQDIRIAYNDIEKIKEQTRVSQENVEAAQEDQKITQEKYNLGAATILDLLTSQESLTEAQVALLRAEFDLNLAIAKLENAMGKM